jgi:RNA 3'-terminal phosphate cyclase (ATP)
MPVITIDGSLGEGGGQILRTALALSAITGKPFAIDNIRAGRAKPGLMRQHLTAVKAAAAICGATVEGAAVGSSRLHFVPGALRAGEYAFNIGSAGSTSLVLQTVLLPLAMAGSASCVVLQGGTHNNGAPPFEFLAQAFLPLLRRIGFNADIELRRCGFYPVGGGEVCAEIQPSSPFGPLVIEERGASISRKGEAIVSNLPFHIAERELARVAERLEWSREELSARAEKRADGTGNVLLLRLGFENVTEVAVAFGRTRVPAETVADEAVQAVLNYIADSAPVGGHLADQLLLPMALGAGGRFVTGKPSSHTLTNIQVIRQFLDVPIQAEERDDRRWLLTIAQPAWAADLPPVLRRTPMDTPSDDETLECFGAYSPVRNS